MHQGKRVTQSVFSGATETVPREFGSSGITCSSFLPHRAFVFSMDATLHSICLARPRKNIGQQTFPLGSSMKSSQSKDGGRDSLSSLRYLFTSCYSWIGSQFIASHILQTMQKICTVWKQIIGNIQDTGGICHCHCIRLRISDELSNRWPTDAP